MLPPVRAGLAWIRTLRGWRADALLAGAVVAEGLFEVAILADSASTAVRCVPCVLLIGFAVFVRRTHPVVAPALGFLALAAVQQLGNDFSAKGVGPFFTMGLLTWSLGRHADDRQVRPGIALALAALAIVVATDPVETDALAGNLLFGTIVVVGLPFMAGRATRNRARLNAALRAKREALERDRARQASEAVLEERGRIAGELHDVVAHALSAMTIQASAARRLATAGDPLAGDAFGAVEHTGREALTELRRLLGVLRREDEELALAPHPCLANLESLARRTRASGLPVDLRVDGAPAGQVPVGVDLTAYRLVQGALQSARDEGAAGQAHVDVRYAPESVVVEVVDDGRAGGDRVLLGMRERVEIYGGSVEAAAAEGRHRVRARFPMAAPG